MQISSESANKLCGRFNSLFSPFRTREAGFGAWDSEGRFLHQSVYALHGSVHQPKYSSARGCLSRPLITADRLNKSNNNIVYVHANGTEPDDEFLRTPMANNGCALVLQNISFRRNIWTRNSGDSPMEKYSKRSRTRIDLNMPFASNVHPSLSHFSWRLVLSSSPLHFLSCITTSLSILAIPLIHSVNFTLPLNKHPKESIYYAARAVWRMRSAGHGVRRQCFAFLCAAVELQDHGHDLCATTGPFIENAHSKFTLIMIILFLVFGRSPEQEFLLIPGSSVREEEILLSNGHLTASSCYRRMPCLSKMPLFLLFMLDLAEWIIAALCKYSVYITLFHYSASVWVQIPDIPDRARAPF